MPMAMIVSGSTSDEQLRGVRALATAHLFPSFRTPALLVLNAAAAAALLSAVRWQALPLRVMSPKGAPLSVFRVTVNPVLASPRSPVLIPCNVTLLA